MSDQPIVIEPNQPQHGGMFLVSEEQLRTMVREEVSRSDHTCTQSNLLRELVKLQQKQQGQLDQILELTKKHDETLYGPGKPDAPGLVQHVGKLLDTGGNSQWVWRAVVSSIIPVIVTIATYLILSHGASLTP